MAGMKVGEMSEFGGILGDEGRLVSGPARRGARGVSGRGMGFLLVVVALALWEAAVWVTGTPVYLIPAPTAVLGYLAAHAAGLLQAAAVTLLEAVGGLALGPRWGWRWRY